MEIVKWQREQRTMSRREIDEFYETPLPEAVVFRFKTAQLHMPEHHGSFSLKSIRAGTERYFLSGRSVTLRPHHVLLVNEGERYGSEIAEPSESLSIFYRSFELGEALQSLTLPADALLDSRSSDRQAEVAQIALRCNDNVAKRLRQLHEALDRDDDAVATEQAMLLLLSVLRQNHAMAPPGVLPQIRKRATRDELLSRVTRAREYLHITAGAPCKLDTLAEIACLSRYHFVRVFSEITGQTPAAYGRTIRLRIAREQLLDGQSLTDTARLAGYGSPSAFARAFKRQFGMTPAETS